MPGPCAMCTPSLQGATQYSWVSVEMLEAIVLPGQATLDMHTYGIDHWCKGVGLFLMAPLSPQQLKAMGSLPR